MKLDRNIIGNSVLAYSLPGSTEFILATLADITVADANSKLSGHDFIFSPYDKEKHPQLLLKISSKAAGRKFSLTTDNILDKESTSKEIYSENFSAVSKVLSESNIDKIVLSKLKVIEMETGDLYDYFINLKNMYVTAFSYLLHIPGFGTWMGASPELVLENKDGSWYSRAVAGTRPKTDDSPPWSSKDIIEHSYVEDHYRAALETMGLSYKISDSYTLAAGKMSHICSDIEVMNTSVDLFDDQLKYLLNEIHPSPALSGFPKEKAMEEIDRIEYHDRSYYCGYLGPLNGDSGNSNSNISGHESHSRLYANIRCMEIFKNGFAIYVGGGIVAASNLDKEWDETEMKAETMLAAIRSVISPAEML